MHFKFIRITILFGALGTSLDGAAFLKYGSSIKRCPSSYLLNVDFEPIENLAKVLSTLSASVIFFTLKKDGQWQRCSGSTVSDEGHILTAGHCLDDCDTGGIENPRQCTVRIKGVETIVKVELEACSNQEYYDSLAKPLSDFSDKCAGLRDVLVVLPNKKIDSSCIPLADGHQVGEEVYTFGQPIQSHRGKKDADGAHTFVSFGNITELKNTCVISQNGDSEDSKHVRNQPGTVINMSSDFESVAPYIKGLIQTTVDILPGSSGGPLVNTKGEVIGVAATSLWQGESVECKGSTFFAPVSKIVENASYISPNFRKTAFSVKLHSI